MAPGVVPDQVSRLGNPPDQRGLGLGMAAHHEERGPHIVAGQKIQQPRRPRRVGPVVEGKRQFTGPPGAISVGPKSCDPGHMAA